MSAKETSEPVKPMFHLYNTKIIIMFLSECLSNIHTIYADAVLTDWSLFFVRYELKLYVVYNLCKGKKSVLFNDAVSCQDLQR